VTPIASALLGAVLGAGLAALVLWLLVRRSARRVAGQIVNRHHLGEILSPLRAAVVVLSDNDRVLACSDFAKAIGMVRGSSIALAEVQQLLADARAQHRSNEAEMRLIEPSTGAPLLLSVRAVLLSNEGAVVIGEDRSADLRFSQTRRDFVANISHELKTPIGAISLLAEAAEAATDDPAAVKHFLDKLIAEADRLNELVSQIIALSRLQAADSSTDARTVVVADVIAAAVSRCREQAEAAGISVSTSVQPGLTLRGDADQLETALTNLVQNAIAYSERGARVAVSGQETVGEVELRVSDTGIGISDADQRRIFERFYRVDADRSRASGGTGLGLSIVKHIASAHGGDVGVWSRPGQGSTFTLRLPVQPAAGDPAEREEVTR